jgi:hypothetical protein
MVTLVLVRRGVGALVTKALVALGTIYKQIDHHSICIQYNILKKYANE